MSSIKSSTKNYRKRISKKSSRKKTKTSEKISEKQIQNAISHQLSLLHRPDVKFIPDDCPSHMCTYIQPADIEELKREGIKFDTDMNIDYLLIHDLKIVDNIQKLQKYIK